VEDQGARFSFRTDGEQTPLSPEWRIGNDENNRMASSGEHNHILNNGGDEGEWLQVNRKNRQEQNHATKVYLGNMDSS